MSAETQDDLRRARSLALCRGAGGPKLPTRLAIPMTIAVVPSALAG
jgi:hypothetical protein